MIEPQPNPETVEALLDTTWRVAGIESERTDALDRKAAAVATFASVLATLTATLGVRFVARLDAWWALVVFVIGLIAFLAAHRPPLIGKVYRPSPAEVARNAGATGRVELWYPKPASS